MDEAERTVTLDIEDYDLISKKANMLDLLLDVLYQNAELVYMDKNRLRFSNDFALVIQAYDNRRYERKVEELNARKEEQDD